MAKTEGSKHGLTDKQKRAADLYLADPERNQRKAYKGAGYKCKSDSVCDTAASRLFSNVKVKAYITEQLEKQSEAIMEQGILSHVEVLHKLKQVMEMALGERAYTHLVPIPFQAPAEIEAKDADLAVAHRAIETYGKYHKLWSDKTDDRERISFTFNFNA